MQTGRMHLGGGSTIVLVEKSGFKRLKINFFIA